MKNFNIMGVHWKIQFLGGGGGVHEKSLYRGNCLKRQGLWTVCRFLGQKEGDFFVFEWEGEGGLYPNAHFEPNIVAREPGSYMH